MILPAGFFGFGGERVESRKLLVAEAAMRKQAVLRRVLRSGAAGARVTALKTPGGLLEVNAGVKKGHPNRRQKQRHNVAKPPSAFLANNFSF